MFKKVILVFLIVIILIASWLFYSLNRRNNFTQTVTVNIESGTVAGKISQALKSRGLITNAFIFNAYAKLTGADSRLVAGTHQIEPRSSIKSIVRQLTINTNLDRELSITIIEGWKIKDISAYLAERGIANEQSFADAIKIDNWRDKYPFLQDKRIKSLEGFLFPDTYRIFNDAKAEDVVKKMLNNFGAKVTAQMRFDAPKDNASFYDALILASIVEREALYDDDRRVIAAIFLNRLKQGIGLQSDATINYITGKKSTRPTYADLQADSPYNTYKYRGLPPGPICNPGLASINAVIYPQPNNYFYFLTDSEGRAHFAKTYAEHQQNIIKYLEN
ncbi:MAG: endolytic transglycosylase MltG [Candidatus Buchananbacteria bacterium]